MPFQIQENKMENKIGICLQLLQWPVTETMSLNYLKFTNILQLKFIFKKELLAIEVGIQEKLALNNIQQIILISLSIKKILNRMDQTRLSAFLLTPLYQFQGLLHLKFFIKYKFLYLRVSTKHQIILVLQQQKLTLFLPNIRTFISAFLTLIQSQILTSKNILKIILKPVIGSEAWLYFSDYIITTDDSIWPYSNHLKKSGLITQSKATKHYYSLGQSTKYAILYLLKSDYINTTMLQDRYKGTLFERKCVQLTKFIQNSFIECIRQLFCDLIHNFQIQPRLYGIIIFFHILYLIQNCGKNSLNLELILSVIDLLLISINLSSGCSVAISEII